MDIIILMMTDPLLANSILPLVTMIFDQFLKQLIIYKDKSQIHNLNQVEIMIIQTTPQIGHQDP
jgi:hypothetical protein